MQTITLNEELLLEVKKDCGDAISYLQSIEGGIEVIDQSSSAGSQDLIIAVIGISLTAYQIIERFVSIYRDRKGIFFNVNGKRYLLKNISSMRLNGSIDEGHSITINIDANNGI